MRTYRRSRTTLKKTLVGGISLLFLISAWVDCGFALDQYQQVVLTLGSWRTQDIAEMRTFLDRFQESHPRIRIVFDPTPAPDYDEVLAAQLRTGTAPDLFYLRSFGVSRKLFSQGYLEPLNQECGGAGFAEHFDPSRVQPWQAEDGTVYGIPFIATSHGIYYNQDLFRRLGLSVPGTWEEFLRVCRAIRDAGYLPLANASGDSWTVLEIVFLNILPNFIGGRQGRLEYLEGRRCFNDPGMVSAFEALRRLRPFLPKGQEFLTYNDSLQLFVQGRAAMWMGGSWDIPFFENQHPAFAWSVFAPPPPRGESPQVTFHLDAGIGLNAASDQKNAAREFLSWLCEAESGKLLGSLLPGFFPLHRNMAKLPDDHANAFLALNRNRGTDIRFVWEKLREGHPDGYTLMRDAAVAVIRGKATPREATDRLQQGLATWFEPARTCARKKNDAGLDQ